MEEVPSIPRRAKRPSFSAYAPLAKAVATPDVVIVAAARPAP